MLSLAADAPATADSASATSTTGIAQRERMRAFCISTLQSEIANEPLGRATDQRARMVCRARSRHEKGRTTNQMKGRSSQAARPWLKTMATTRNGRKAYGRALGRHDDLAARRRRSGSLAGKSRI